jgi:hypothetical protein
MRWIAVLFFVCCFCFARGQEPSQDSAIFPASVMDSITANVDSSVIKMDTQLTASLRSSRKKFNVERVRILIGMNYSFYNPVSIEKDEFSGPYYPVKDSTPEWTDRNTKSNLAKSHAVRNFQFSLKANFWKGLFIGANYQFFSVKKYKKDLTYGNLLSKVNTTFFLVSANVGYVFEFLKNKCLQIEPSISIGGYTSDDYYDSGKGKKFYFSADCKIRYLIKKKFGFSVGANYDFIHYKKLGHSDIFQRDTFQKTTFSNIHLNAGICYNITIRTQK